MSLPDNASTMAVFSAPGVSKQTKSNSRPTSLEIQLNGDTTSDSKSIISDRASTLRIGKHGDGNDTPASRRSLERLQTSNILGGGSETASVQTGSIDGAKLGQRLELLRSPSTVAIVGAPGVAEEVDGPESDKKEAFGAGDGTDILTNGVKEKGRPGMYDRSATGFVTASEGM